MELSHSFPAFSATFDDPNLVSCAGLAPTMALAKRAGLTDLVSSTLTLKAVGGVNAHLKIPALVAGMVAGADLIDDMDLLRHGGMGRLGWVAAIQVTRITIPDVPDGYEVRLCAHRTAVR